MPEPIIPFCMTLQAPPAPPVSGELWAQQSSGLNPGSTADSARQVKREGKKEGEPISWASP
jgi:hypothetical protein